MTILKIDYPAVLSKAAWDKKKGVMAKLAVGKTDVGAGLTAVETAFKASGFAAVNEFGGLDPIEYVTYETGLIQGLTRGAAAVGVKLSALKIVVTQAHTDFGKSLTVPKSSTAYVKSILDQIEPFRQLITQYPGVLPPSLKKAFQVKLRASIPYIGLMDTAKSAPGLSIKIVNMIKQVEAKPTIANLHKVFGGDGPHRMLTTSFKAWDQLAKAKLPTLAARHYTGTAMTDLFTLPHLQDMGNENMSVASNKLADLVQGGQNEKRVVEKFCLEYTQSVLKSADFLKAFAALGVDLTAA